LPSIGAILRREFAAYFNTPLGYFVLAAFLLTFGFFFFYVADVLGAQLASMRGMFDFAPLLLAVLSPIVTMRLVAEERGTGTIELLMTLPVSEWQVVVGKYLAAVGVLALATLLTLPYAFTLEMYGEMDLGPVFGGYAGLLLMGAAYAALGLFCSALTGSQIVAALSSLLLCFAFWVVDKLALAVPGTAGSVLRFLGFDQHFADIQRGVLDSRDIVFYATFIAVALAATTHLLRRQRLAA
jgi:ABC-2 type transport system permease protein